MLRSVFIALAAISLAAAAPAKNTAPSKPPKKGSTAPAPTYSVATTSAYSPETNPVWATAFSVYSTYNVYFAIDLPASMTGRHAVALETRMPNGLVYQRWELAFATDAAAAPGELQAEVTATGWRVWVSMPVAGTMIQKSNLVGTWAADAFLDGDSLAGATTQFSLY